MLAHESRDFIVAERVLGQHERRSARAKLLAGLKKPEHRSLDPLAYPLQHEHRSEQAGRVDVVPARMHHALVPGSVFQTGLLLDRQRIHVGTQHDATAEVSPALDPGQNARSGYRPEFDARLPQAIGHITGSLPLLERQFGIGMQSPPGKQHLLGNSLRRLFDRIIGFHTATIKSHSRVRQPVPPRRNINPRTHSLQETGAFAPFPPSGDLRPRPLSNGSPTRRVLPNRFPVSSVRSASIIPPRNPERLRQGRFPVSNDTPRTACIQSLSLYERHAPANAPNTPSGNRTDRINTPFSNLSRFGLRPRSAPLTLPAAERTVSALIYGRVDMPKAPSIPNKRGAPQVPREPGKPKPAADENFANAASKTAPARS